jgi:hypothetical protein
LIHAGGNTLLSEIQRLIKSVWNKNELKQQKDYISVRIYKRSAKADCSNYSGISLPMSTHKILSNILVSSLTPYIVIDQLLITCSVLVRYWGRNESPMGQSIS